VNLKSIIAAVPILRRLWRWMPGPMKVVVLGLALVVGVKRMLSDDEPSAAEAPGGGASGEGTGGTDQAA
jgi:hypothetical protein